jgi:hypothetical protein
VPSNAPYVRVLGADGWPKISPTDKRLIFNADGLCPECCGEPPPTTPCLPGNACPTSWTEGDILLTITIDGGFAPQCYGATCSVYWPDSTVTLTYGYSGPGTWGTSYGSGVVVSWVIRCEGGVWKMTCQLADTNGFCSFTFGWCLSNTTGDPIGTWSYDMTMTIDATCTDMDHAHFVTTRP